MQQLSGSAFNCLIVSHTSSRTLGSRSKLQYQDETSLGWYPMSHQRPQQTVRKPPRKQPLMQMMKYLLMGSESQPRTTKKLTTQSATKLWTRPTDPPSRYFPLKRAKRAKQYTLGRVFLRGAYIFTDYERQSCSVSQALYPDAFKTFNSTLVGIPLPGYKESPSFGAGVIAGIIVGSV